jgi:hypothetical protein
MIIPDNISETLKQMNQTNFGQALKKVLEQKKEELNDVSTIKTLDELLGRQHAIKLIDDIFNFMQDKKVEVINKNQYI